MDRWLNNAPALVFVKDVFTWLVVNNKCELILWTEDKSEATWYLACLECGGNEQAKSRLVKNTKQKAVAQAPKPTTPEREKRKPAIVIPLRAP